MYKCIYSPYLWGSEFISNFNQPLFVRVMCIEDVWEWEEGLSNIWKTLSFGSLASILISRGIKSWPLCIIKKFVLIRLMTITAAYCLFQAQCITLDVSF